MTKLILFVVSCLFIAVFISMNTAEESIYASLFSGLAGYRVRNPLTSFTLSDSYLFECCMRCLQYKKCYSVNINGDDRFCEINTLGPSGYGDLVDANGIWTLFIRTNGKKMLLVTLTLQQIVSFLVFFLISIDIQGFVIYVCLKLLITLNQKFLFQLLR